MQVRFRRLLIDMVLGTDMKQHFNLLSKFQSKLQVKLRSTNIGAYSHSSSSTGSHLDSPTYDEPLPIGDDEADKSLVLQVGSHLRWLKGRRYYL